MEINRYIDHTLLKPTATIKGIEQLCKEAIEYRFFSVCVNSSYVTTAFNLLKNIADVKVCSVVGFPLGAMSTEAKIKETQQAILDGAEEIDMVINLGNLKSGNSLAVEQEIKSLKEIVGDKTLKVIIETCYLTNDEKILACKLALNAGADFVKTSTGFGTGGATFEDIKRMKDVVKDSAFIKASGGIRDFETAKKYINLGANRLGTSSGIAIVEGNVGSSNY